MKKFQVKLELSKKTVDEKVEFGRHVVTMMTGNANFTTPSPTLLVITGVTDDLETANDAAAGGGSLPKATLRLAEAAFDLQMTSEADYVNGVAKGSETIIKSAGMQTRNLPGPAQLPTQVINLLALLGLVSGESRLRWKKVLNAKIYFIYMCPDTDDETNYVMIGTSTSTRFTVKDLTPGNIYWFKVKAVGAAGAGDLSDPGKIRIV